MEDIISRVLDELKDREIWFISKSDNFFYESDFYYNLDEYGDPTEKECEKIVKEIKSYIGDGAVGISDAIDMWIDDGLYNTHTLAFVDVIKTQYKQKPVVDQIEAYKVKQIKRESNKESKDYNLKFDGEATLNMGYVGPEEACKRLKELIMEAGESSNIIKMNVNVEEIVNKGTKTEGYKIKLKEANDNSREALDEIINAEDFDSESNEGKIVLKAQELFNKLTDLGYNINVSIDNGDIELDILLGEQGGKVCITLNSGNQVVKAFASGNFKLDKANLDILDNINKQVENI